jgi:hypothetical protein
MELRRKVTTTMNSFVKKKHGESNVIANGDCVFTEAQGPLRGQ